EMTGLDVDRERIIEAAILVTDSNLEVLAEGPELVIHQSDELLGAMDAWNTRHHGQSGLTERVRASTITESEAEEQLLQFVKAHCDEKTAPLAGNSIWQDRRFLARYMPRLEDYLHYRLVDVSTLKELARRWRPDVLDAAPAKRGNHRALDDIRESLEELRHYRARFIQTESSAT
ncbi:MAG: oligoribonuclease, partial [Planctomycetota bacterium]